jgi:hypothetical protein
MSGDHQTDSVAYAYGYTRWTTEQEVRSILEDAERRKYFAQQLAEHRTECERKEKASLRWKLVAGALVGGFCALGAQLWGR